MTMSLIITCAYPISHLMVFHFNNRLLLGNVIAEFEELLRKGFPFGSQCSESSFQRLDDLDLRILLLLELVILFLVCLCLYDKCCSQTLIFDTTASTSISSSMTLTTYVTALLFSQTAGAYPASNMRLTIPPYPLSSFLLIEFMQLESLLCRSVLF